MTIIHESLHRYITRANHESRLAISHQVFGQYQLGTATFVDVIDLVECGTDEKYTEAPRLDDIVRTALHVMGQHLFAIIAQPQAHTSTQPLHPQRDGLIVTQLVRITDNVGACFIHAEHHQQSLLFRERIAFKKIADAVAHQSKVRGMTAELDFAPFNHNRENVNRFRIRIQA